MSELFFGIRGKPYQNQMVHSELLLKIKCSKAVSHFSLSHLEKKFKFSSIRHLFASMVLNSMSQIPQSSYFCPLQQISMDRNAITRSDLARRELQNPTRLSTSFIVPENPKASLSYTCKSKLMQRPK